jgi:C-terminal processing protease CtpA/Prc
MRPDGSCFEGEGLQPDVAVECTPKDLETRDPILEKALELLRKKAGK